MKVIRVFMSIVLFLPGQAVSLVSNVITAFVQIWANKIRSLLTVLGIIIAVTSIITVVSFVQGFGNYVTDFLRGLGTNLIVVYPEWIRGPRGEYIRPAELDIGDIRAIDQYASAISRTAPRIVTRVTIEYGRQQVIGTQLVATSETYQRIRNFYVDRGRFFSVVEVDTASHVCVLGRDLLRQLECDEDIVDDYVFIDGERFRVVGLLESRGSFMGEKQDELALIPWTTGIKMYPHRKNYLAFYVEASSEDQIPEAEGQIARILRQRHDIKPGERNDFGVFKQDQVLQQFNKIREVATGVLVGIVSISLLVGGIGIMNVMLVSVTERTREIGLRKSVGARRRDILMQFLTEAVVLSTVGGVIGVIIGYGIGEIASLHPKMVPVEVPFWSVALALGFSAGVGIFFGIVPAFKAAIVHPIDALRHE